MPRRYTMTDLIDACMDRIDMENDELIDRARWAWLISEAYGELYTIVFEACRQYFEYSVLLTTDGTATIPEPLDHLSTVTFSYLVTGAPDGQRRDLRVLEAQERSRMSGQTGGEARHYMLVDDKIYLFPTPPAGQVYEMRYIAQPPQLVEVSGDQAVLVDVVTPMGLTFLTYCACVKAISKNKDDWQLQVAERDRAKSEFAESAELRAILDGHRRIVDKHGGLLDGFDDGGGRRDWGGW